jgi:hypothetical protein
MFPFTIVCSNCRQSMACAEQYRGRRVKCPRCLAVIAVPPAAGRPAGAVSVGPPRLPAAPVVSPPLRPAPPPRPLIRQPNSLLDAFWSISVGAGLAVGLMGLLLAGARGVAMGGMLQFGFFLAMAVFSTICVFAPRRVLLNPKIAATIGVSQPGAARAVCAVGAIVLWCLSLAPLVTGSVEKPQVAQAPAPAAKVQVPAPLPAPKHNDQSPQTPAPARREPEKPVAVQSDTVPDLAPSPKTTTTAPAQEKSPTAPSENATSSAGQADKGAPKADPLPKPRFAEKGEKVEDGSWGVISGNSSGTVSIVIYNGDFTQALDSHGGPPAGTLWFIAETGMTWKGHALEAGRIYRADDNHQPQLTIAGEYTVWGQLEKDQPAYKSKGGGGQAVYTVPAKEWVQLLLYGQGTVGWHRVRWGAEQSEEGWVQGGVGDIEFRKHSPIPADSPDVGKESGGSVGAMPAVTFAPLFPPEAARAPAGDGSQPGTLALPDPFDKPPPRWPTFFGGLAGGMEVRVKNPNKFAVRVGLRSRGSGLDFVVQAGATQSAFVRNGQYDIYFQYSNDAASLYQGDSFTLANNGIEIQIVQVVNGNYGIRKVE